MAIGRTFQESFQKALRGLETDKSGLDKIENANESTLHRELNVAGPDRIWYVGEAFRRGMDLAEVHDRTKIDPWFLAQIEELITIEQRLASDGAASLNGDYLRDLKRKGFSDARIGKLVAVSEAEIRELRIKHKVRPVYKRVDSCAAEFDSATAYLYSTYEDECEAAPSDKQKIIVLGGGPNRIGQGIEFDYCCVHAAMAMREAGFESIMINCNPETVSTDYDTSDRLYFEPLTLEDVLEIVALEDPVGVIVQFGGQTPLKLARDLESAGVPIIGTTPDSIDLAEDRERFQRFLQKIGLRQPPNRTVRSAEAARAAAAEIGYPLVVRPSYVLGGRAMEIVYSDTALETYMREAVSVSNDSPVLLDRFLESAIEVDVDAISDGEEVVIGGIMEHIEQAGIHSGDSACALPPHTLSDDIQDRMREQVTAMARGLNVVGLMNTQFAIQGDDIFVIEVNPRASRTIPFVSKAIGLPLAKIAARCMIGHKLVDTGLREERVPSYHSVKEAVFPFVKFPGVDPLLGPEMKSTGEVMGIGISFGEAFGKAQQGAGMTLPDSGVAFISVRDQDKAEAVILACDLVADGFEVVATRGTARAITAAGVACASINKVQEGQPHIVDMIKNDEINLIVNTTHGEQAIADSFEIRRRALQHHVAYTTTIAGATAAVMAIARSTQESVRCLQDLHKEFVDG